MGTDEAGVRFTSVRFRNFKALGQFSVTLNHVNVLVGPNNAGKSTILSAFRILAAAIQRAGTRQPEVMEFPSGPRWGYRVPLAGIPVSVENVHTNYEDRDATIDFRLSNGRELSLYWPAGDSACILFASQNIRKTGTFKKLYPVSIGIVPTLGPIDQDEKLVLEETLKKGLLSVRASSYFRNYWYHFPEDFGEFQKLIVVTWPGVEIEPPSLVAAEGKLVMFCRENRTPRELYWAGFGFQVWCQSLTHVLRANRHSVLIIDEPEIYLHPELQRQLLAILRGAGPDVLVATHSSDIVSECDPAEVLLVDKAKQSARRIVAVEDLQVALQSIGSLHNLALTQLSRTRRAVCVEGEDFSILRQFATRLGYSRLGSGADVTVIRLDGFPTASQIRAFGLGLKRALSVPIRLFGVFDRDYRCDGEVSSIRAALEKEFFRFEILNRKELENYLLVPEAIDRAVARALKDNARRTGSAAAVVSPVISDLLEEVTSKLKSAVGPKYVAEHVDYESGHGSSKAKATLTQEAMERFEDLWSSPLGRLEIVPGKQVLSALNAELQPRYKVQVTPRSIIDSMHEDEIPADMRRLVRDMERFRTTDVEEEGRGEA